MAREFYTQKNDTISFNQICLEYFKKILEITTHEFTGGYWNYVYIGNVANKQYVTDKRKEFIQAVEMLAIAIYPHFDKRMKKDYEKYLEADKILFKKYKDEEGFISDNKGNKLKHSIEKLEIIKELFKDLSCCMHRLDYFKTSTYSEGDVEEVNYDDDD
jgi:hypothetical protein